MARPRKIKTASDLRERAERYFAVCDSHEEERFFESGPKTVKAPLPYTVEGLCNALKITRRDWNNYCHREDALGVAAQMTAQRISENRVVGGLTGKQNANLVKFLLSNNDPDNYQEKQEVKHSGNVEFKRFLADMDGVASDLEKR